VVAASAVVLGAAYMLWMVQRVFFGEMTHRETSHLRDLNVREIVTALPFVVLCLVMGLIPQPFLDVLEPAAQRLVARANLGNDSEIRMNVASLPAEEGGSALGNTAPAAAPMGPGGMRGRPQSPYPLQVIPQRPLPQRP
jgi:NADH-quinone oxidoreductase subunit M